MDKKLEVLFETKGNFDLIDEKGKKITSGEAKIILDEEKMVIFPKDGQTISISLREVSNFLAKDFNLCLLLPNGEKIFIEGLGYEYDDFLRTFIHLRQKIIQKDLLMNEGIKKTGFKGYYDYEERDEKQSGKAEVEIYETALVLKPQQSDLIRISFSEIIELSFKDYQILIKTETINLSLSHFGEKFDSLSKNLTEALGELSLKTQTILKEFLPDLDPITIKKAADLLKDGQAVEKRKLDEISPEIWKALEKGLEKIGIKEFYNYLKTLVSEEQIFMGIKRDLMGDLTGEYIWFLAPIISKELKRFIVMEAGSTIEEGAKATYIFRIPEGEEISDFVKKINRCMIAINFRREPIYLKDEDLEKPDYLKYKTAIAKIPELKLLRQVFVKRIIHSSLENWTTQLMGSDPQN